MVRSRLVCSAAAAVLATLSIGLAAEPASAPSTQPVKKPATTAAKPPKKTAPIPAVSYDNGKLKYLTQPNGDRMPDYSYAGYHGGEMPIPTVAAKLLVAAPTGQDDTRLIQAAIDQVAKLPADANGLRGAILLAPGEYKIRGQLKLTVSGVVIRGSGFGENGTTLLADGTDRRTVIQIAGTAQKQADGGPYTIADDYVPVGSTRIRLNDAKGLQVGDSISIRRPSTDNWIETVNMDDLGGDRHGPSWKPGTRDVVFARDIAKIDGNTITLSAPLTLALDTNFGGGTVTKSDASNLVRNAGVENLSIVSTCDEKNPKDEEHAWFGVGINQAADCWVRRVTFKHLAGSAVAVWESARRVTVEDCKSLAPVGEIGGWRRYSFFATGQQVLMQRLYSEAGFHDFAVGFAAAGPNAFVQCESVDSLGESGPIDSIACGTLYDRVRIDGQPLTLRNRTYQSQGAGWASFNGTLWNSVSPVIECWQPPTAQNWAFGTNGEFAGNGAWYGSNDDVNPESLYYAQLGERIGTKEAAARSKLIIPPVQGSRAPTLERAAEAIEVSMKPRVDVSQWIDELAIKQPIEVVTSGIPKADLPSALPGETAASKKISIKNGWLLIGGKFATGGEMSSPWWNGGIRPGQFEKAAPALTRFVPGRTGTGLTDDLNDVAAGLVKGGRVKVFQFPPLWYERRRDDHERVQRMDGDVVAPFYETPWERSGLGRASDGLSKWDVTKTNRWYFDRLRNFADLAEQNGLVLFNGLYQQHNILEAGGHYADAPWRPKNNVNPIGIPEPVFFAGDKLIYVAQQFYDISNPGRAASHRAYMRAALNELADKPNVVFYLSEEYTGPLEFTQFWLDTIAEWEAETGKKPLIALYATKDVTDAILSDAKRAAVVSIIANRYNQEGDASFWYQPDGKLYAPQGGKNLSPRQWGRLLKPKPANFEGVLRAVNDYRTSFPDKPFVYTGPRELGWAVILGGGSLSDAKVDAELAALLPKMQPLKPADGIYELSDGGDSRLIYGPAKKLSALVEQLAQTHIAKRLDPKDGVLSDWKIEKPDADVILWLWKK